MSLHPAGLADGQEQVAGEVGTFFCLCPFERQLPVCQEDGEREQTNQLSMGCFLHLAQQSAILQLK